MLLHLAPPRRANSLPEAVGDILRLAAQKSVMARFRHVCAGDIEEKSPGELVTIADCEAEIMIYAGLSCLLPEARVVGEETASANPALLSQLDQGKVWIIDPIDGTSNYARGRSPFAMMVALLDEGEVVASAIFDPLYDRMVLAERGCGAFVDGVRIRWDETQDELPCLSGVISNFERPAVMHERVLALEEAGVQVLPTRRCAGHEYPKIATGEIDFALYWRRLVWDHAPGVLIAEESGGRAAGLDGAPYRASDPGGPLLIARNADIWERVARKLATP